jgi:hypothetical protein
MNLEKLVGKLKDYGATPKGGISAPNAIANIQKRKEYNNYAIEKQSAGETPVPYDEYAKSK